MISNPNGTIRSNLMLSGRTHKTWFILFAAKLWYISYFPMMRNVVGLEHQRLKVGWWNHAIVTSPSHCSITVLSGLSFFQKYGAYSWRQPFKECSVCLVKLYLIQMPHNFRKIYPLLISVHRFHDCATSNSMLKEEYHSCAILSGCFIELAHYQHQNKPK